MPITYHKGRTSMNRLEIVPVATVLVLIYALIGGALVILSAAGHVDHALQLSFKTYLEQMAIAVGGLAIGRGLAVKR